MHEFERASKKTAPEQTDERRRHLNFVVVGGGATGIEMAGAMVELFDIFKKEFHSLDFREVQVTLLEAMDSVLPMVPPDLQQHTIDVLRKKGVDVRLNTAVTDYDGNDLTLKGGEVITATISLSAIEELGLAVGKDAYAVIKATSVMVGVDHHHG